MGIISDSVLQHGGSVIAVVPDAMLRAGGEGEQHQKGSSTWGAIGHDKLEEKGRDKVSTTHLFFCDRRYSRDTKRMTFFFFFETFVSLIKKVESVSLYFLALVFVQS